MIWHHMRRRTHKRLAPKPVPPEGMMWNPWFQMHGGEPIVPIETVEQMARDNVETLGTYRRDVLFKDYQAPLRAD